MVTKRGGLQDVVPVWFALCAALFVLVACGGDSSGTSADPEGTYTSENDLSSGTEPGSSSSWRFFYSSVSQIPSDTSTITLPDSLGNRTDVGDTGDVQIDTLVHENDTIPDTSNFVPDTDNVVFSYAEIILDGPTSAVFSLNGSTASAVEVSANGVAENSREVPLVPEPGSFTTFSTYRIKVDLDGASLNADASQKVPLSVIANITDGNPVVVNLFTHLQTARALVIMERPTFVSADDILDASMDAAATDIWEAFNVSLADVALGDTVGLMLALHAMLSEVMLDRGAAFLDTITQRLARNGVWGDSPIPAAIADALLLADVKDGFADLRERFSDVGNEVDAGFEAKLRAFYQDRLGISPCKATNVNKVFSVINGYSRFAPEQEWDFSTVSERFMCNADGKIVFAPDSLKDTYSFEDGEEGEVRVGAFTGNLYYTYDGGAWRPATAIEKDSYFVDISATDNFADIKDVYEGIKPNERVIFVLRHAERGDDTSKSGTLTDNGKKQSQQVGQGLTLFPEDFVLGASEFLRAHQTVEYIARGRGQQFDIRDTFPELNDNWYEKNHEASEQAKSECGGGWELTSKYAYTGAYTTGATPAFHPLAERSVQLIEKVLLAKYNDPAQRFVMLSSHDKVMVPLVVYCTKGKVNLKKHDGGKWLNYLAGVAIIIDELGNRRYVPVRGLSSAYM